MATEIQGAKIVTEEIENAAGANPYSITLSAEQATTSLAARDFTSIPAGVKEIKILLAGVSTSGTSALMVQLGDSGGIETTGYVGTGYTSNTTNLNITTGMAVMASTIAAQTDQGMMIICLQDSSNNTWVSSNVTGSSNSDIGHGGSFKSLSGVLTQVRLTTVGGSDTFDAGAAAIQYQ